MRNQFSIDIDNSINSGQVFLWEKCGSDWYGINGQDILKINKNAVIKSIQNSKTDFFRKKDNMQEIIKSISKDKTVKEAIKQYEGLRIFNSVVFGKKIVVNLFKFVLRRTSYRSFTFRSCAGLSNSASTWPILPHYRVFDAVRSLSRFVIESIKSI